MFTSLTILKILPILIQIKKKSMAIEQLKEKVRFFISHAKTQESLDEMTTWAHANNQEQLKSDLSLLKGDLTDLIREKTLGLLGNSEATIRQNQLNNKVLNLLNTLKEPVSKEDTNSDLTDTPAVEVKKKSDKLISVFISYSKKDNELREELDTHLSGLRRRKIVSNWDDRHIIGGELWDETIQTKLKEADIILFLVSANFINTDYIWENEIPIAEEQRINGKARVIPIILKPCQWTKLDFAKQQALPSKGVPINSFPDRDTAWLEVVESIEKVINDLLK
jgi:TIR domain/Effector-associated domain 11